MNKAEMVSAMAQHTGLSRNTIKDLMKNGWYYEEQADTGRARFLSPDPKRRRGK